MEGTTPGSGHNEQIFSHQGSKLTARTVITNQMSKYGDSGTNDNDHISMMTQYVSPRSYQRSERTELLAMPKPQYHGKDFF